MDSAISSQLVVKVDCCFSTEANSIKKKQIPLSKHLLKGTHVFFGKHHLPNVETITCPIYMFIVESCTHMHTSKSSNNIKGRRVPGAKNKNGIARQEGSNGQQQPWSNWRWQSRWDPCKTWSSYYGEFLLAAAISMVVSGSPKRW